MKDVVIDPTTEPGLFSVRRFICDRASVSDERGMLSPNLSISTSERVWHYAAARKLWRTGRIADEVGSLLFHPIDVVGKIRGRSKPW